MKATFEVLCSEEKYMGDMMNVMKDLNFKNIKKVPKSTVSDVEGVIEIERRCEVEWFAEKIYEKIKDSGGQMLIKVN